MYIYIYICIYICTRDSYFYVPLRDTELCDYKLSCSRKVLAASGD